MNRAIIHDLNVCEGLIRERKRLGIDRYDEVWDGVYVMPSMPNMEHQKLVHALGCAFDVLVVKTKRGDVYEGANVSDRDHDWVDNHRVPDVLVVLKDGRAITRKNHVQGGPDFLVEIQSPGDDTEAKIPFYGRIGVCEMLIIHRDTRTIRLLRNDGEELVPVEPTMHDGVKRLVSEVLPVAFRRVRQSGKARTELFRTDGKQGRWIV